MMKYLVDVQGFKTTSNEFIFKEVAVVPLEGDPTPSVFLFKPPYPWEKLVEKNKSENRWLESNFHGIMWRMGSIPYEQLTSTLCTTLDGSEIYVKGLEKTKWLRKFFPDRLVFNVEDMGCPSLKSLSMELIPCNNHPACEYPACALRNAMAMKKWMLDNKEYNDMQESFKSMYI